MKRSSTGIGSTPRNEVDHIIPLQGQFVSGLHVPENLRVIPRSINRSKRNKVDLSI